jgi:hypothetical protein
MDNCNKSMNMEDACSILKKYIDSRNGKATYKQCFCYLNNGTNLTQIQIYTCLEKFFPGAAFKIHESWFGIM